jgi:competence protein ComEC
MMRPRGMVRWRGRDGHGAGPVRVISPAPGDSWLARMRHALADHVRSRVAGSAGGIAAAFASGDRGGIPASDEQAMRDLGLTTCCR